MERGDLYQSLYTHEEIYRPLGEEQSAALEVCLGCSWGKCTFCDFARDAFCVHDLDRIEHDVQVLATLQPDNPRVFFLGENAFCLTTAQLLERMAITKRFMPQVTEFAMYARIDDIERKSAGELGQLKEAGLDVLHVGVESGCDDVLAGVDKGVTSADIVRELHRLDTACIGYCITIVPGLAGKAYSRFHAMHTARLLDQIHPRSVWALKLHLFPGTPLHRAYQMGQFDYMEPVEVLQEEYFMLQNIHKLHTWYQDTTVLDKCTLQGNIPEDMEDILLGCQMLIRNAHNL